jgi:hypothetical protein
LQTDPGLLLVDAPEVDAAIDGFVAALARHRHVERETDHRVCEL